MMMIITGDDHTPEQIGGGGWIIKAGGEVKILPFIEGQSITASYRKVSLTQNNLLLCIINFQISMNYISNIIEHVPICCSN
jgi:hypothetical protein